MRWKEIKDDASSAPPPAGWAEELDQGIDDVDHGRVTQISEVISDLDATLTEMSKPKIITDDLPESPCHRY